MRNKKINVITIISNENAFVTDKYKEPLYEKYLNAYSNNRYVHNNRIFLVAPELKDELETNIKKRSKYDEIKTIEIDIPIQNLIEAVLKSKELVGYDESLVITDLKQQFFSPDGGMTMQVLDILRTRNRVCSSVYEMENLCHQV